MNSLCSPCSLRLAVALCALGLVTADVDLSECEMSEDEIPTPLWVEDGGFLVLIIGVIAMFWALAVVCEEYFVPALTILCEEINIPESLAGATFMAAGASSPEMFTAFVALFVDHSALGVGTVVGSEIFNHMIICAGSVMYSSDGVLYLNKYIFSRDVAGYGLSIIVLIWTLKGNPITAVIGMFESGARDECLEVTVYHALGVLVLYVLYVVVCANFQATLRKLGWEHVNTATEETTTYTHDPLQKRKSDTGLRHALIKATVIEDDESAPPGVMSEATLHTKKRANQERAFELVKSSQPSMPVHLEDVEMGEGERCSFESSKDESESKQVAFAETGMSASHESDTFGSVTDWVNEAPEEAVGVTIASHESRMIVINGGIETESTLGATDQDDNADEERPLSRKISFMQPLSFYVFAPGHPSRIVRPTGGGKVVAKGKGGILLLAALGRGAGHNRRYQVENAPIIFLLVKHGEAASQADSTERRGSEMQLLDLQGCDGVELTDRESGVFMIHRLLPSAGATSSLPAELPAAYQLEMTSMMYLGEVITGLKEQIDESHSWTEEQNDLFNVKASVALGGQFLIGKEGDLHHSLIDAPHEGFDSARGVALNVWHYLLYPLKFLLHYSLPDVLLPGGRAKYPFCLVVSVIWLAVLSFIMVRCCDELGVWIGTTPIVMGLTLSAIGTSFPNLWSSMLVARKGQGNMAVSNAFGSNTFNICIALGLPWLCLTLISGQPYYKMRDDGIVFMLVLLLAILVLFYVMVALNSWRIKYWMSFAFIAIYLAVIVYAVVDA